MGFLSKIFGRPSAPPAAAPAHVPEPEPEEPPADFYTDLNDQQVVEGIAEGRFQVVDVRFKHEWDYHHIEGASLIPLPELDGRFTEINIERETVFVCEHGMRSLNACYIAWQSGMEKSRIYNLVGGMAGYRGPKVTGR